MGNALELSQENCESLDLQLDDEPPFAIGRLTGHTIP